MFVSEVIQHDIQANKTSKLPEFWADSYTQQFPSTVSYFCITVINQYAFIIAGD